MFPKNLLPRQLAYIHTYICCKKRRGGEGLEESHLIFPGWAFVHIERENNIYFFEKTTEKPFPNQKIERNG